MWKERLGLAVIIVLMAVLGFFGGRNVGEREERTVNADGQEVEKRILAWIVERNPNATIKDFSDFPTVLIAASRQYGFDYRLVLAIADKESEMNPKAVSPKGAIGLLQVMPATANIIINGKSSSLAQTLGGLDYRPPVSDKKGGYTSLGSLGDPKINVVIGLAFFKEQVDKFGLNEKPLRAYNRGPSKAQQAWPHDRYAEDVAFGYLALTHTLPAAK